MADSGLARTWRGRPGGPLTPEPAGHCECWAEGLGGWAPLRLCGGVLASGGRHLGRIHPQPQASLAQLQPCAHTPSSPGEAGRRERALPSNPPGSAQAPLFPGMGGTVDRTLPRPRRPESRHRARARQWPACRTWAAGRRGREEGGGREGRTGSRRREEESREGEEEEMGDRGAEGQGAEGAGPRWGAAVGRGSPRGTRAAFRCRPLSAALSSPVSPAVRGLIFPSSRAEKAQRHVRRHTADYSPSPRNPITGQPAIIHPPARPLKRWAARLLAQRDKSCSRN